MTPKYPLGVEFALRRVFDSLGEQQRRLYAAAEAVKLGHGGMGYIAGVLGCDPKTIRQGKRELQQPSSLPPGRSRKKGVVANGA